jgi:hypothetical protein
MTDIDSKKVTIREVADVVALVAIELVATLVPDLDQAEARLEDFAGRLMDVASQMPKGTQRELMGAIAETLIATEEGAGPDPDL